MAEKNRRPSPPSKCPITFAKFRFPVRTPTGHVYEREAIVKWLRQNGTDPLTRLPLDVSDLQPAHDVMSAMRDAARAALRAMNLAAAKSTATVDLTSEESGQGGGPRCCCHEGGGGGGACAGACACAGARACASASDVGVIDLTLS